jgi:hypothetical protein
MVRINVWIVHAEPSHPLGKLLAHADIGRVLGRAAPLARRGVEQGPLATGSGERKKALLDEVRVEGHDAGDTRLRRARLRREPHNPHAVGRLTRDWHEIRTWSETDEFRKALFAKTVEADRKVVGRVAEIANRRGVPPAQVTLAWLLHKPVVTGLSWLP